MTTLTVNRPCSRCPRTEQTEVSVEEVVRMAQGKGKIPEGPEAVVIHMGGDEVASFKNLCGPCREIVSKYIQHIITQPKHSSSLRSKEEK